MPGRSAEDLAHWRAKVLDAALFGPAAEPPAAMRAACRTWLAEVLPEDAAPPRGVAVAGLPEAWRDTLAWAGVPLSGEGPLRWGTDLVQADVPCPELKRGILRLPSPDALSQLTSLALKPLRLFVAERLQCRLQAAPGIRLWLWPGRAVLQSLSPIPLAGFIYGASEGHRSSVALDPWGSQVVEWPI